MRDDLDAASWRNLQQEASPRIRAVATAINNAMSDIDMTVSEGRWVTVDATYRAENWQKVIEYLARGAITAVERFDANQEEKDGEADAGKAAPGW